MADYRGYIVFGIDKLQSGISFRLLQYSHTNNNWQFTKIRATEDSLIEAIANKKATIRNVGLDYNRRTPSGKPVLVGLTGSLSRFSECPPSGPCVILSQIVAENGLLLGYKVILPNGNVENITLEKILQYCEKITNEGHVPFQNGQYIKADGNKKAFIRAYKDNDFFIETLHRKKSEHAKPAKVNTEEAAKKIERLEELFNAEQIHELKLGKASGVNIKIYGNNKLSAQQMKIIREALEEGLDAKLFASPEFSELSMRLYRADLKYGVDISYYLNPKYNAEQCNELSLGYLAGVDVSQFANPKYTAEEMAERRMRLESGIWSSHKVNEDSSWKD